MITLTNHKVSRATKSQQSLFFQFMLGTARVSIFDRKMILSKRVNKYSGNNHTKENRQQSIKGQP